jgi:preprotein translocase subunit YajC
MDPLTILMVVILAALVFFMWRNSRKRRHDQEQTRSKMVPGAEVMTNFGLYGTLVSVNEDDYSAVIETSPGHVVKVHRQVLARVVEPTSTEPVADDDAETPGIELNEDHAISAEATDATQPEYGERLDDTSKKPGSKSDD